MKAVSDIIAVLLMLIITIGLAGLAYSYISGIFTSRTAVVLTIDPEASTCSGSTITVYVRNDGTSNATVSVKSSSTPGAAPTVDCGSKSIAPGTEESFTCTKSGGAGYYQILATAPGSTARGQVYCPS